MNLQNYEVRSEFLRNLKAQARLRGLEQGQVEGLVRAVLEVLDARGLAVTDAQRQTIVDCTEIEVLLGWLHRAATASRTEALFG